MKTFEEYQVEIEAEIDRQERVEHRDVLLAIAMLIKTKEGSDIFRYLFKSLGVAELPDKHLEGNELHEYLGFLRAGNSIFKLVCEADPNTASSILSKLEREKYERLYQQHRLEQQYFENANTTVS